MADLPGNHESPRSYISLPAFSLAAPTVNIAGGIIHLGVSGAVEWQTPGAPSQINKVDIFANSGDKWLQASSVTVTPPTGAWDGLLLPYTGVIDLGYDSNGNPFGANGDSYLAHPQVYQYLHERWGVPNTSSPYITL